MNIAELPSYESPTRGYIGWHPKADYLWKDGEGWDGNLAYDTWADFIALMKDTDVDLNLVADFYFSEESKKCPDCEYGYSPVAQRVEDDFYDHAGRGTRWCDKITEDEFEALKASGRAKEWATAEEANRAERERRTLGHDAINRGILVEARCKRLGIGPLYCPTCNGEGSLNTGRTSLYLWWLHPRKGASRGITIGGVESGDLPEVKAFLRRSFEAHQRHFAWALEGEQLDQASSEIQEGQ